LLNTFLIIFEVIQGANNFLTQFHDFSTMAGILTGILSKWTQHQEEQSDVAEKPSLVDA